MVDTILQVLNLRPGLNREGSNYSNEGGWYSCDKIRFRSGLPEKLGGWMWYGNGNYNGICRHFIQWASLSNFLLIGVGTNTNFYILTGGEYFDITPVAYTDLLDAPPGDPVFAMHSTLVSNISATLDVIPITAISGSNMGLVSPIVVQIGTELIYVPAVDLVGSTLGTAGSGCTRGYLGTTATTHLAGAGVASSWLVVKDAANKAVPGDTVVFAGAAGFNDLLSTEGFDVIMTENGLSLVATEQDIIADVYTAADINGERVIVASNATYIAFDSGIYSTISAQGGGSSTLASYLIASGSPYSGVFHGWGAGPWNSARAWNQAFVADNPSYEMRLWSAGNFGQNLFFNPRDFGIYMWDASKSLNSVGQVTGRGVSINDNSTSTSFASVPPDQVVIGNYYTIISTGGGSTNWVLDGALSNTVGIQFFCTGTTAVGTGWVTDLAIPSVATYLITTDQRHVVAFGCNDPITATLYPTPAGSFIVGEEYFIVSPGTTDFTLIGAASSLPGTKFTATGVGAGTGTAGAIVQDTMYISWCAQEQPQVWWPTQTNSAGNFRLTIGSKIITVAPTRQETLVFTDLAVYSMQYLGAPYTFGFNLIDNNATIASPNAFATTNNITYWMGQDKFYAYAGRVETLPCALRQYVFDDINQDQIAQVYAGTNEKYNEIWWFYPSQGSIINDRYVIYNYLEKVWYYGNMVRTAWLDSYALKQPIAAVPNISNALEPQGIIVQHEIGADDGSVNPIQPISAYIQTSDFDIGNGGYKFAFVKRIIPDMDFIGSTTPNPTAHMTLTARNYPGQPVSGTDPMQNAPATVTGSEVTIQVYGFTEDVWVRLRGRQLQFRIASDDLGVRWQLGSPRLQIQEDGRRG